MTTLHDINHNAGGAVTNFWDSETDPSAGIAVKVAAGLNSTANGLAFDMTVNDTMEVDSVWTPPASNKLFFSCYLDPNGNKNIGDFEIFRAGIEIDGGDYLFRVLVGNNEFDDTLNIGVQYKEDGGGTRTMADPNGGNVSDAPHFVEVEIIRESGASGNDGEVRWWLDSVLQDTNTDAENFSHFADADQIYARVTSVGGGGVGDFYYDEILITDGIAAAGISHIWLSTDGGATYSDIGDTSTWLTDLVGGVVVVPGTAYQTIFAAVGTDLYETVDGGTNWTLETAIGYEADFIDLEKDNTTIFISKRDAAGSNRASLWDSVGASLSHINTGKSTTGGSTAGGDVV